jgi:hypothetical protein
LRLELLELRLELLPGASHAGLELGLAFDELGLV